MGSGYHSRTPEELKKYLESLTKSNKKRNRNNIIIFIDIILIMIILYAITKVVNPSIDTTFKLSNKLDLNGIELFLVKSNSLDKSKLNYFLFFKNKTDKDIWINPDDWKINYQLRTTDHNVCTNQDIGINKFLIKNNQSNFISLSITKPEISSVHESCKNGIEKKNLRGWHNLIGYVTNPIKVDTIVLINNLKKNYTLIIPNEKW